METELKKAVLEVYKTAEASGIAGVLIGALIAELSPEIGPDYPRFRRTNDADFALHVPDWTSFQALRARLIELDFKQHPKIEHRLLKGSVLVDLIPYGKGVAPNGKLRWPESDLEMNVIGFEEACAAAGKKVLDDGPDIPIITIPGFVLLKIIAFLDRQARWDAKHKDDAGDIYYWLKNYASGTADDRRFAVTAKLGGETLEYETAGAALLGLEVGQLASKEAGELVDKFLNKSGDLYTPFMDAIAGRAIDEDQDKQKRKEALDLLNAFEKGCRRARQG